MIFTSYYSNSKILSSRLKPIRISWGFPRFKLSYKIIGKIPELTPEKDMRYLNEADYIYHYRAILEEETVEAIKKRFQELGDNLVLLCFCNPGKFCHRSVFAKWWDEKTGEEIKEL